MKIVGILYFQSQIQELFDNLFVGIYDEDGNRVNKIVWDDYSLNGKMSATELNKALQLNDGDKLGHYVGKLVDEGIISFSGRGKGCQYFISPNVVNNSRSNIKTSLKTIEPYRLRALILEDLRFHPDSLWSDIAKRLPDVKEDELQNTIRKMALDGRILGSASRKYRRYRLP